MAHTPGPWKAELINKPQWAVTVGRFNYVCITSQGNDEANARLIAAAPDLLALVERVIRYRNGRDEFDFSKLSPQDRENAAFDAWMELEADLNAAIAKVRDE